VADLLLHGSIWLSLLAWAAAECIRLRGHRGSREDGARVLWTAGVVLAVVHVALAFHLRHGWSQASAWAETARQTRELLGRSFGWGLFVNYAFLIVWAADAAWWWRDPVSFSTRSRLLDVAVRLFLLFIFVNGAIVFGQGAVRILGFLAVAALVVAWYGGRRVPSWEPGQ
jgi:hypothetical protein